MSSLPYERATAGDRALQETQKILEAFGCQRFGTMVDNEHREIILAFNWRGRDVQLKASWNGYANAWMKAKRQTGLRAQQKALEQGRVSVCSCLRDWVKGQVTAVECGIMSFEAVFMPHMLLPTGERVIERVERDVLPALAKPSS